jgi:hypothetical protein
MMEGYMMGLIVALLLGIPSVPATAQTPTTAPCPVSDDDTYGYTAENPIQIGGGALYVKARETRYLDALRGPDGQAISYKRRGAVKSSSDPLILIDVYEVTYDGRDEPVPLYLDAYHYWEQRAPKGFTCVQPIQLQPMMDGFRAMDGMRALAVERGSTQSFAPIPLAPDGSAERGVILDAFRMIALDAAARGDKAEARRGQDIRTVIVAHPMACGERAAMPTAVEVIPAQGPPVPRTGDLVKGDALERLTPGLAAPPGSLAAVFPLEHPRRGDRVRIVYDGPACDEGSTAVLLPVSVTPARAVAVPEGALPDGADPAQARLLMQAVIDTDGAFTQAIYVGGPAHLKAAAAEALKGWRAEPARVNGAPIPSSTLLEVRFK